MSAQGCARSNDHDLARLRSGPTRQVLRRDEEVDASSDAGLSLDEAVALEAANHLIGGREADPEMTLHMPRKRQGIRNFTLLTASPKPPRLCFKYGGAKSGPEGPL